MPDTATERRAKAAKRRKREDAALTVVAGVGATIVALFAIVASLLPVALIGTAIYVLLKFAGTL